MSTLKSIIAALEQRHEEDEGRIADSNAAHNQDAEHIAALEAENERLRCCGNCDELGGDYGDECCRSWLGPVEPFHAYRPPMTVQPYDHCHFTPSRWTRRDDHD